MNPPVTIRTLTDGGQTAVDIASEIAAFIDGAQRTLELAQYDFELGAQTSPMIANPIPPPLSPAVGPRPRGAPSRAAPTRLLHNVDPRKPIPVPPPPSPDETLIQSLPVEAKRIAGVPDLMHHKFVVRDGKTVWTGSTNWTDDSWTRQENVITVVESAAVAAEFLLDFQQLVTTESVASSGYVPPRWRDGVRAWFTPAHGEIGRA